MHEARLSRRLYAAFLLVEGGKTLADIGTDHGYLPIALVQSGRVPYAIASDINPLPLQKARENIEMEGLSSKVELFLADGAQGLEGKAEEIVIAGMGGELIADIVDKARFVHTEGFHMVLQPMTKIPFVRRYLWDNGFSVLCEKYVEDAGHFYTVLSVVFTGKNTEYDVLDAEIGKPEHRANLGEDEKKALLGEIGLKIFDLNNKIRGKSAAGINVDAEKCLCDRLVEASAILEGK